jgi:hypothetical protein
MHLRVTKVKQKNGVAEFVQLVESERHPETGVPRARVIQHLGRKDQLDVEALKRLVKSISRFIEQPAAEGGAVQGSLFDVAGFEKSPFEFVGARSLGAVWLLDGLWKRFGIDRILGKLLAEREFTTPIERLLFAMVANRAVAPCSKLAMEAWVARDVVVPGLDAVGSEQLYRAMDFLLAADAKIQEGVFFSVANLLNLEVDVLFLDTTSTYFEVENPDEPGDERLHLRQRGYSKDNHPELPQVVIGFAMTKQGIPVRCWTWPGNTGDQSVIEQVKRDLNGWKLGRVVTVADAGFNSEKNRRILQQAGGHYIIGEKLRVTATGHPAEALSRGGRFKTLDDGLEIKEVKVGGDGAKARRYVVVKNPDVASRDKAKRDDITAEVERRLAALKELDGEPHQKAECALRSHATFGRYVTQTPTGRLKLHRDKIASEELLDGKFLVSTSDDSLSVEEIVYGYKALWAIERTFRDMKHVLDLRPVYHRLSDRIRAHVLLCWLAMVLVRVAENETGETWPALRAEMGRHQLATIEGKTGTVQHTSRPTAFQIATYKACKVDPPPKIYSMSASRKG